MVFTTTPGNLSSTPRAHMVKGENSTPSNYPLILPRITQTHTDTVHAHTPHTHTHITKQCMYMTSLVFDKDTSTCFRVFISPFSSLSGVSLGPEWLSDKD